MHAAHTGTWTAVLDPGDANTGSVTFALAKDVEGGTLTPGRTTTTKLPFRGQQARYSFKVTGGQHFSFDIAKAAWSGTRKATIYLFSPGGNYRGRIDVANDATFVELDTGTAFTGRWTAVLDPDETSTGAITFTLAKDAAAGKLKRGVAKKPVVSFRGQHSRATFAATSGRSLTFDVASVRWSGTHKATMYLFSPDGRYRGSVDVSRGAPARTRFATDPSIGSGTWTAVIDPDDATTGSIRLTLR